jgi:flavin reductase
MCHPLADGQAFRVKILIASQIGVAKVCGGSLHGEEHFAIGDWQADAEGTPFLADAQVNLFCRCGGLMLYGTHGIFVGRVKEVRVEAQANPLLYADGGHRGVGGALLSLQSTTFR